LHSALGGIMFRSSAKCRADGHAPLLEQDANNGDNSGNRLAYCDVICNHTLNIKVARASQTNTIKVVQRSPAIPIKLISTNIISIISTIKMLMAR